MTDPDARSDILSKIDAWDIRQHVKAGIENNKNQWEAWISGSQFRLVDHKNQCGGKPDQGASDFQLAIAASKYKVEERKDSIFWLSVTSILANIFRFAFGGTFLGVHARPPMS